MPDTTAAGRHRTALALRKLDELDYEATGQLPATYNPRCNRTVKVLAATGKVAGKGCLLAGKGAWAVTKYVFVPSAPKRSIHIHIIERESRCPDWLLTTMTVFVVVLVLAAVGSA